jgi:O-methyltransferase
MKLVLVKKTAKKIFSRLRRFLLPDVYARLDTLEYRAYNRRFYAIEQCAEYLVGAQIDGDYLEFGVYQGNTFIHAYQWISPHFEKMRFFAFDSFEGLPKPQGTDSFGGYTSNFHETEFSCSQEDFRRRVISKIGDLKRVKIVPGWFDKTLLPEKSDEYALGKIALAWIDCDLYESTVPVLTFITPHLTFGSVIVFDDWRAYRNHPDFGEQRACREWLAANPQIQLAELFAFGSGGIAFTVTSC